MAKRLDKSDIASLNTIRPYHVSQSVDAFTGIEAYDINISGSFQVTGSTILSGSVTMQTLTTTAQTDVLTYNSSTGRVYYTASNAFGAPLDTGSFYKQNGNSFGATAVLGTNDNNALRFETNATTKMHIGTDGNVGINTTTPLGKFTVSGSGGYLSYNDTDAAGNLLVLSGSSDELVRTNVSTLTGSQPSSISYGMRGIDEVSYPGYGKPGDAFMYISNYANGLNIINYGDGIKEDYIRFYAGKQATSQSDIHIQGSGSTKGYVGVNTETPTSRLHVNGTLANGNAVSTPGIFSHAEGNNTTSSGDYSHAEGRDTLVLGVGAHAEGIRVTSSGNYSHAEGNGSISTGVGSHAEGLQTTSSGNYSHAEGRQTLALGNYSHAGGFNTTSSNDYSYTNGIDTKAFGTASHAEGGQTIAMGDYSHTEGSLTLASGFGSHAEGFSTTSSGIYSHAEGRETFASGSYSFTHGYLSKAPGDYAHAGGIGTVASGSSGQSVVGRYNQHGDSTSRFIVGNGTDDSTRVDAFKVTSNNTIIVAPRSATPSGALPGIEGEMVPVIIGGAYYLYVYIEGSWRRTALTI